MRKIYALLLIAVFAFVTGTQAQTYLTEGFESQFTPNTSAGPNAPSGWTQTRLGTLTSSPGTPGTSSQRDWAQSVYSAGAWASNTLPNVNQAPYNTTTPAGAYAGSGAAWFNDGYAAGSGTTGQNIRRIESPAMNLTGATSPIVTFAYALYSGSCTMNLVASADGGTTWNTLGTYAALGSSATWSLINVSLPAIYKVANAKIGFVANNTWGSYDLLLDNVLVKEAGSITSTATGGLWSATTTWTGGVVPTSTDNVTIANGATVTVDVTTAVCNSLTVGQGTSGILQYDGTTTAKALTVNGSLTIAANGTLRSNTVSPASATTHTISIGGDLVNNGTLNAIASANSLLTMTFTGGANNSFTTSATASTTINKITLNKGTANTNILDFNPGATVSFPATGFLTLTNGTFKVSGTQTISNIFFLTASYSIPGTAGFWLNNANATVTGQAGSPTMSGLFRLTTGIFNVGTAAGNSISGATTSSFIIEGGTFNIAGRINVTSSGASFNMSAGTMNVCTVGNTSSTTASFGFTSASSVFTMSGGTINLVQASTGATPYDWQVATTTPTITGGTLNVGTAATATNYNFRLSGAVPNLVIDNTTNNKTATLFAAVSAYGNTTINSGATLNLNAFTYQQRTATLTNNGILTGTTTSSRLSFFSPTNAAQTFAGSGTVTSPLDGLSVQTTGGLTITHTNSFNTLRVNLFAGTITNSNKITLGTGAALAVTVQVGAAASTQAGGNFDVAPTFNLGTGIYLVTYQQELGSRTTGFEIPSTRSIGQLTINNTNGVTLSGGALALTSTATTALTLTAGKLITTNTNLLTIPSTATTTTSSANSYVQGSLAVSTAATAANITSFTFPIGDAAGWRPLVLAAFNNNNTAQTYRATVINGATGGNIGSGSLNGARYFELTNTANIFSTSTATVQLSYGADDIFGAIASAFVAQAATSNGTYTSRGGVTTSTPTTGIVSTTAINQGDTYFVIGTSANIFTSVANADWSVASTWDKGSVPSLSTDVVVINTAVTNNTAATYNASTINVNTGASLMVTNGAITATTTIANSGTLTVSGGALTATTSITNGGTMAVSGGALTATTTLTNSNSLTVSGGTLTSTTAFVNAGTANVSGGTFSCLTTAVNNSGATITVSSTGTLAITSTFTNTGTYNANGGTTNVIAASTTGITNSSTTGVFNVAGGTINLGITNNTACNRTFLNNGTLTVSSGTLNIFGNFNVASSSTFNQSGGNINVDGNAAGVTANSVSSSTYLVYLYASAATNLNLTGGTLTIVDPHPADGSGYYSLYVSANGSVNQASSNHTIKFGNGVSTDPGTQSYGFGFYLFPGSYLYGLGNVTVDAGTGVNRFVKTYLTTPILGNLTITSGEFRASSTVYLKGNLTNNGLYSGTSTLSLVDYTNSVTAASSVFQTISGSGSFRNSVPTASVSAGGSGYVVGDILTVSGGTYTSQAQFIVTAISGSAVSTVQSVNYANYSILPTTPAATTGGTGTGATLTTLTNFTPTANLTTLSINNNNSTGVLLSTGSPLFVSGTLTLTSGFVNTSVNNELTLGTTTGVAGTLSGGSSTAYIKGPFRRVYTNPSTISANSSAPFFPVGYGAVYNPMHISATVSGAAGGAIISVQAGNLAIGSLGSSISAPLSSDFWNVTSSGPSTIGNTNIGLTSSAASATAYGIVYAPVIGGVYELYTLGTYNASASSTVANLYSTPTTGQPFANGTYRIATPNTCTGGPTSVAVNVNNSAVACVASNTTRTFTAVPTPTNVGYTYQWQSSTSAGSGFTNIATYNSAAGATSSGTTVTVTSTANLTPGMVVTVSAGTGAFAANTTVATVPSATTFTVSATPATALSGGASVVTGTATSISYTTPVLTTPGTYYYIAQVSCAYGAGTTSSTVPAPAGSTVVVAANPIAVINATPAGATYCGAASSPVTLAGSGASTTTWSAITGLYTDAAATATPYTALANVPTVYARPSATTTYTLTVTDANSCTGTATQAVTLAAPPNITPLATPSSVCVGAASSLSVAVAGPSTYCAPVGGSTSYGINSFSTTGGATNITNNSTGVTGSGYNNYTASYNVTQAVGSSVNFSVTTVANDDGIAIWVDWNQNGTFETGERMANTTSYSLSTFTGSFTVPAGALNGATRMRVLSHYTSANPIDPCVSSTSVEIEDYKFTVTGGTTLTYTYAWAPGAYIASGASTMNATTTNLTGTQAYTIVVSDGTCSTTGNVTVTATPLVVAPTITPVPKPQPVANYNFSSLSGTFTEITGTTITSTTTLNGLDSYISGAITLPTAFSFAGVSYTTAYVTSNGLVGLGSTAPSAFTYTGISTTTGTGITLCPLNADLSAVGTSDMQWAQVGNEIIFQWKNFHRYNVSGEAFDFQARLNTSTGVVKFVYGGVGGAAPTFGPGTSYQPQVGIRTSTTDFKNIKIGTGSETWASPITAGTVNTDLARLTTDAVAQMFNNGQTYVFTPATLTYCSADVFTLNPGLSGGTPPYTYTWSVTSGASGLSATNVASPTVSGVPTNTYNLTVTDGCTPQGTASGSVTRTVNTSPSAVITATPANAVYCGSTPVTLAGSGSGGAGGTYTTTWTPATSLWTDAAATTNAYAANANVATVYSKPSASTTYTLTVTDANSCNGTVTNLVSVATPPVVGSVVASPSAVCAGGSTNLTATIGAAASYCTIGTGNGSVNTDNISSVALNTLNHTGTSGLLYSNNPATGTNTTTLTAGNTYPVTVGTQSTGTGSIVSVWIDFDQNGTFSASEWVQTHTTGFTGTANIAVPAGAKNGLTRMRIRSRTTGNTNGSGDACTVFGSGNTEDFTISITGGVAAAYSFAWTETGSTLVSTTGATVVANNITANTTYSVTANDGVCNSAPATVLVPVSPLTASPAITALSSGASSYGFTASNPTNSFTSIVGTTGAVSVPAVLADSYISPAIPIGFSFNIGGASYTNVYASSNGFLSFNSGAGTNTTNSLAASTAANYPLVAPLWDDLDGSGGGSGKAATYVTTGTAPNRIFTFEWKNFEWYWLSSTANISFQCKLYEGSGKVEFVYENLTAPTSPSASIGIATAVGNYLSLDGTGTSPNASSTTETTTIASNPATGQTYTFELPVNLCPGATSLLSSNVAGGGAPYTFSWTSTPAGFTSAASTVRITPTVTTVYHLSVTDNCGNSVGPLNVTATVQANPVTASGNLSTVCGFNAVTLTASGATSYTWSPNYGLDVATGATVVSTPSPGYIPAAVTGYNADIVANGVGTPSTTTSADVDGNGNYFNDNGFYISNTSSPTIYGLPSNRVINSIITPGLAYNLAAYSGNNSLRLAASASGTLNLSTPASVTDVFLLGTYAAATGSGTITALVTFTDATTQTVTGIAVNNWLTGLDYAATGFGYVSAAGVQTGTATTPRFFDLDVPITIANRQKTVASVQVTNTTATGLIQIVGVSIKTAAPAPVTTYTVTGAQGGCSYTNTVSYNYTAPPALTLGTNVTSICAGTPSSSIALTSTAGSYNNYVWESGANATGSGPWTLNPSAGGSYELTATQTGGSHCINKTSVSVTVNPVPNIPTITPVSGTVCASGPYATSQLLTASDATTGGTLSSEDFASSAVGTNPPSGWTKSEAVTTTVWEVVATAVAGGAANEVRLSGINSATADNGVWTLQGPSINASAYSTLQLSFKHMVDVYSATTYPETLSLETSTNNTTWTQRWSVTPTGTTDIAANTVNVDLSAVAGQSTVYYRFVFTGKPFGLNYWYIDDVAITGTQPPSTYTWSLTPGVYTGLFTNAGASTAYTGAASPTVYARPTATSTYKVTASTVANCTSSANVTITATQPSVPSVTIPITSGSNPSCSGGSVTFTAVPVNAGASPTYQWYVDGSLVSGATASTFIVSGITTAHNPQVYVVMSVTPNTCATVATATSAITDLSVQNNAWTGSFSNSWGDGRNWCSGTVPNAGVDATIPILSNNRYPVITNAANVKNINIVSGATVTVNNVTLTIAGVVSGAGMFIGSNASGLTFTGTADVGTLYFGTSGINSLKLLGAGASATLGNALNIYGELNVGSNTLTTNNNMTMKSTINGTAWLATVGAGGSVTGNVTVERYIPQNAFKAWRLLSVPTQTTQTFHQAWQENQAPLANGVPGYGTLLTSTTGANGYDAATAGNSLLSFTQGSPGSYSPVASTGSTMMTKSGYMVFIRGDRSVSPTGSTFYPTATTLRTNGPLYIGSQTAITLPANTNVMVGNIYASPIDFATMVRSGVTSFKVWDPKLKGTYNLGGYQSFSATNGYDPTPGGGSFGSTANSRIESGQAFIVSSASGGSIQLTEAAKTTGSRNVFRTPNGLVQFKTNLYAETSAGKEMADGNAVIFSDEYSNGLDEGDVIKAMNIGENLSITSNATPWVLEGRKTITSSDTIHFGMSNLKQQQYTFEFVPKNMDSELVGYLEDSYTNTATPVSMNSTTVVSFKVTSDAASSATDRFRIVFSRKTASIPVTTIRLQATADERNSSNVKVSWTVRNQDRIARYEIERSADGSLFGKTGAAQSLSTGAAELSYTFIDEQAVVGVSYYRVKGVSQAGEVIYSNVVKVVTGKTGGFNVYPNPVVNNHVNVEFINQAAGRYTISLVNKEGRTIYSSRVQHPGGTATQPLTLSSAIAAGTYQLEIQSDNGLTTTKNVVISNK